MGPSAKRRKLNVSAVEEVTFDSAARFDYLTGFHKRKVQRTKAAQEAAARRGRQERIEDRKKVREERKADLERHVQAINALLPSRNLRAEDADESDQAGKKEWEGLAEASPEPVDHEAEYIDEDKYTTVTVEEVDISRDGISKLRGSDDEDGTETQTKVDQPTNPQEGEPPSKKKTRDKDKKPKKKKKTFRYESPADRKLNRAKVRAKNSKAAKARRGD